MKFTVNSRTLSVAVRIVGLFVIVALVYLAYTVWSTQRDVEGSAISSRAIENLAEQVKKDPNNVDARVLLGQAFSAAGRLNEAVAQFQEALKIKEDQPAAIEGLGLVAMRRQEWRTAEGYWQRLIDILAAGPSASQDLRLERAFYYMGVTLIELKEYEDAVGFLKEALRIRGGASTTHYALSHAYKELGSENNQRKELEIALAYDPRMPEANYEYGLVMLKEGDEAGAAELFRRAADAAPGRAEPLDALAGFGTFEDRLAEAQRLQATDTAAALREVRVAVALDPTKIDALRLFARLIEIEGTPEEAQAGWERVAQAVPGDAEAQEALTRLDKTDKN